MFSLLTSPKMCMSRLKVFNIFRRYTGLRLVNAIEISNNIIFIKYIHNLKYFTMINTTSNILSKFYRSKFTKKKLLTVVIKTPTMKMRAILNMQKKKTQKLRQ